LKEAERRVAEMRAERDKSRELPEQMKEYVSDVDALIDSWIETFSARMASERAMRCRCASPWIMTASKAAVLCTVPVSGPAHR
jgi:hypothetical protein